MSPRLIAGTLLKRRYRSTLAPCWPSWAQVEQVRFARTLWALLSRTSEAPTFSALSLHTQARRCCSTFSPAASRRRATGARPVASLSTARNVASVCRSVTHCWGLPAALVTRARRPLLRTSAHSRRSIPPVADVFNRISAYVLQDDIFFAELTVHETITLSARLRYASGSALGHDNKASSFAAAALTTLFSPSGSPCRHVRRA